MLVRLTGIGTSGTMESVITSFNNYKLTPESKYKRWYACSTRSRAEKKVAALLDEKGIESWVPLVRSLQRWSDRKKWVDKPLIPGYCFVRIIPRQYLTVLQTDHVVCFVKFEGEMAAIADSQIDFLRRMLHQTEYQWEITREKPKPGQRVEIIAGPLIGLKAELVSYKNSRQICVRIDQIEYAFLIQLPLTDIVPALP
jgi:transcription antitermination factor NusG